jgi:hypothetical protein
MRGGPTVARNGQITNLTLRRFMLGSGALKRTSDRLEVLARVLVVCSVLTAVPIALTVATETHVRARLEAVAEAAARHQVTATLLEDAPVTEGDAQSGAAEPPAAAVWTGPDGVERKGFVVAPAGTRAGFSVPIWLDAQGDRTKRPLSGGDIAARSVGYALLTLLVISGVALVAHLSFRKVLDRSRCCRWAREWATVEPRWTHRVS